LQNHLVVENSPGMHLSQLRWPYTDRDNELWSGNIKYTTVAVGLQSNRFSGTMDHFWLDALPDVTDNSHRNCFALLSDQRSCIQLNTK